MFPNSVLFRNFTIFKINKKSLCEIVSDTVQWYPILIPKEDAAPQI